MKRSSIFLYLMLFIFAILDTAQAESILFEDFEDADGFTIGGGYNHSWIYWGIAPISGTATVPSNFIQGGSQTGNIFYGSFGKAIGEPAPTMTLNLPDLIGYTNLEMTVALAAPEAIWENSHRDRLHITGDTGSIDNFLPTAFRRGYLQSQAYSSNLLLEFQDFKYTIDSDLNSITFTFASTDYPEVIGIDSVKITGDPIPEPATMLLLGSGLIGLAGFSRKFRKK